MQASEKLCPLCAESIKAAAIRCKHCHADLRPKGKRWLIRLAVAAAVALAAYLVFSDSEDKAETDGEIVARAVIRLYSMGMADAGKLDPHCVSALARSRGSVTGIQQKFGLTA